MELLLLANSLFAVDFAGKKKGGGSRTNLNPFLLGRLKTKMHVKRMSLVVDQEAPVRWLIVNIQAAVKLADADHIGASDPFCIV
jgi:hypothetical protein